MEDGISLSDERTELRASVDTGFVLSASHLDAPLVLGEGELMAVQLSCSQHQHGWLNRILGRTHRRYLHAEFRSRNGLCVVLSAPIANDSHPDLPTLVRSGFLTSSKKLNALLAVAETLGAKRLEASQEWEEVNTIEAPFVAADSMVLRWPRDLSPPPLWKARHASPLTELHFSADGRRLVLVSKREISIWTVPDSTRIFPILAFAFAPKTTMWVAMLTDAFIVAHNVDAESFRLSKVPFARSLGPRQPRVLSLAFHDHKPWLYVFVGHGSRNERYDVLRLDLEEIDGEEDVPRAVVAQGNDYNESTGHRPFAPPSPWSISHPMVFYRDVLDVGRLLYLSDGLWVVWVETEEGLQHQARASLKKAFRDVASSSFAMSPKGTHTAFLCGEHVKIADFPLRNPEMALQGTLRLKVERSIQQMCFLDEKMLLTCGGKGLWLTDVVTKDRSTFHAVGRRMGRTTVLACSSEGRWVAWGGTSGRTVLYNRDAGDVVKST